MQSSFYKTFIILMLFLCADGMVVRADIPMAGPAKDLSDKLGDFRAVGPAVASAEAPPDVERISYSSRKYKSPGGRTYLIDISQTRNNSAAYALLASARPLASEIKLGIVGAASIQTPQRVLFCKGDNFAVVFSEESNPSQDEMLDLARQLAQQLDGENDIPALVKHLPAWDKVGMRADYIVTVEKLKNVFPKESILEAVSFEGGAEAAVARYDSSTLVIIEFNTPQIATTNDQNIRAKISELGAVIPPAGTSSPPIYRRIGNYAVFVFDAPTQEAANQLIDQVKYQQVVTWLGENPFSYEQATREFTETTLGVFVSVVKASGIALVSCLAIGGFAGALLFNLRRSQQRAKAAYVDSDAMLRLNLDELTPESDPARLLGSGH
ncbi:MAG TPA: DUF6599 family protein [Pyrinomonadaceae bacterium]|nr:DUF6599 family protein [Pyrinomonadaceae bacterium]